MLGLTIRYLIAAMIVAAAALGTAATAPARPQGPCRDVPFVGVCTPWRGSQAPSPHSRFDLSIPVVKSNTGTGSPQGIG
ncbi:hypothetical protein [Mycobacterium sp. E740]|uniref:hypothetical protein n=1 Tax=Mycobacterium sp. E740 TaxID=1834149 RepID=UPI000AC43693|nr:hypothetical protein [Mycobacterium sp. E740]